MRPARILFCFLLLSAGPAHAGPWTQKPGGIYSRLAVADEAIEGETATRSDVYVEYGLRRNLTLTAKAERVDYGHSEHLDSTAWRATARYGLFQYKGLVGSAEAGLLQGAAISGRLGCDELGIEARAGLAWSGRMRTSSVFTFAEIASRQHGSCQTQRAELGTGQTMGKNVWLISQLWIEQGDHDQPSSKMQTELMWRHGNYDISLGFREGLTGIYAEQALVFSLARRY